MRSCDERKIERKINFDVQTPSCKLNILASRRLLDSLRYFIFITFIELFVL